MEIFFTIAGVICAWKITYYSYKGILCHFAKKRADAAVKAAIKANHNNM